MAGNKSNLMLFVLKLLVRSDGIPSRVFMVEVRDHLFSTYAKFFGKPTLLSNPHM